MVGLRVYTPSNLKQKQCWAQVFPTLHLATSERQWYRKSNLASRCTPAMCRAIAGQVSSLALPHADRRSSECRIEPWWNRKIAAAERAPPPANYTLPRCPPGGCHKVLEAISRRSVGDPSLSNRGVSQRSRGDLQAFCRRSLVVHQGGVTTFSRRSPGVL